MYHMVQDAIDCSPHRVYGSTKSLGKSIFCSFRLQIEVNPVRNSSRSIQGLSMVGALAAQALAQRVKTRQNYLECNPAVAGL